ncbi:MAG: AAA family ATPase [Planctomycetota bacterium]|nr:AAA family ATPase [Planctomycetota bacterium]
MPPSIAIPFRTSHLVRADLAAMEIVGHPLISSSLWIGVGRRKPWEDLKAAFPRAQFAGAIRSSGWNIELPSPAWREHRHLSLVGKLASPNIIYFPPEDRYPRSRPGLVGFPAHVTDVTAFNWHARPEPRTRFEDLVLTMSAIRPQDYEEFRLMVNLCLRPTNKVLRGFNDRGYLVVTGERHDGQPFEHRVKDLSSGERQMLLVLGFTIAFLREGGIVLVDEPDLHIHTAMTTQLMQMLGHIVQRRRGQLIVASHSETVWEYFSRTTERLDLNPWTGGPI